MPAISDEVYEDVYVRFADGSFRSPDVAIYCEELPDVDGATEALPVAATLPI